MVIIHSWDKDNTLTHNYSSGYVIANNCSKLQMKQQKFGKNQMMKSNDGVEEIVVTKCNKERLHFRTRCNIITEGLMLRENASLLMQAEL